MASSDVSSVVNHFSTTAEGFTTTLSSTAASGATTLALTSTSGLTNGNIFVGIIEPGTAGKEQTFTGVVDTGGNQITGVKWTRGSNTGHNAGVTIVDYVSGTGHNMMTKGLLVEHDQDGTHGAVTATSLAVSGATTLTGATTLASWDGWQPVSDSWSYASGATTNVGTITVPTDATTRYQAGMKLKFTQTTVKYAIITKVEATTLTIYMGTDYTIANAAISAISVSNVKAPFGFPTSPAKWTITASSANDRSTTSTSYASLTDTIVVPIGLWELKYKAVAMMFITSTSTLRGWLTLSSDASTETHSSTTSTVLSRGSSGAAQSLAGSTVTPSTTVSLAASTTFTLMGKVSAGTIQVEGSTSTPTIFEAVCAYL